MLPLKSFDKRQYVAEASCRCSQVLRNSQYFEGKFVEPQERVFKKHVKVSQARDLQRGWGVATRCTFTKSKMGIPSADV
jgi:hypothetical protein